MLPPLCAYPPRLGFPKIGAGSLKIRLWDKDLVARSLFGKRSRGRQRKKTGQWDTESEEPIKNVWGDLPLWEMKLGVLGEPRRKCHPHRLDGGMLENRYRPVMECSWKTGRLLQDMSTMWGQISIRKATKVCKLFDSAIPLQKIYPGWLNRDIHQNTAETIFISRTVYNCGKLDTIQMSQGRGDHETVAYRCLEIPGSHWK